MGGQDADPGEKQELARNILSQRVGKRMLDVEVPNREGQKPQTGCIKRPDRRLHPTNASEHQISSCNVGAIHR
jgi:hypothetical protein